MFPRPRGLAGLSSLASRDNVDERCELVVVVVVDDGEDVLVQHLGRKASPQLRA